MCCYHACKAPSTGISLGQSSSSWLNLAHSSQQSACQAHAFQMTSSSALGLAENKWRCRWCWETHCCRSFIDCLPTHEIISRSLCLPLCSMTYHMEGSIRQRSRPLLREYRASSSSLVPAVRLGPRQTDTRCFSPSTYITCQKYQASGERRHLVRSRTRPAKP